MTLFILIFSVFVNLILGLTVFIKNSRSITNRLFALLALSLSGWSIVSYLSLNSGDYQLFLIRMTMFFVVLSNSIFLFLSQIFPDSSINFTRRLKYIAAFCVLTLAITLSPFLFTGVKVDSVGNITPIAGPGMLLFLAHAVLSFLAGPAYLFKRYLKVKSDREKLQFRFVIIGMFLLFTLLPLTNFIFPVLFSNSSFITFSPVYAAFFAGIIGYAIVKHRLLDIKRTIARSVAYLLSLGFIGIVYGSIIFGISSFLAQDNQISSVTERGFYIFLALLSAIIFSPTKRFFDRQTKRVFYRDAYEPQQFLDELNSTVVENIELGIMLRHTTRVIQDNLKSQFCYVMIKATPTAHERLIGSGELNLSEQEAVLLKQELIKTGKKTVMTDELGSDYKVLKDVLFRNNIAMLVRLLPGSDMTREAMYYLILGDKKSGNVYDKQDLRLLEIVADELLIAIQNSIRFEEIQQFNVTLQQKVSDATEKLQRTNKKLRELDETKDEFISMASHQLRTPLTSVKGYMSMVIEGDAGKLTKQQQTLLNQAFVSSQRMVYLIADLLNVSRLKTGKFVIDAQPADLGEVVKGELDQLTETAKGKKIELKYDRPKKLPKLMLDETKVRQVVMNFIDNAIYYTRSGGHIKVTVAEDESHVYFTVKDDGIGVPKEDQKHLFNKFFRAGNARNARPDGTGLGLFMAKKVVDAQGGSILFESTEGKGSMFGFCFDKKKLAADIQ